MKLTEAYLVEIDYFDDILETSEWVDFVVFATSYKDAEKQVKKEFKKSEYKYDIVSISKMDAIPLFD